MRNIRLKTRTGVRVDLKDYYPLVVMKAIQYWRKLPPRIQLWYAVEDLIQIGVIHFVTKTVKTYDPKKGKKLSTYLFTGLDQLYKAELEPYYTQKRFDKNTISIEAVKAMLARAHGTHSEYANVDVESHLGLISPHSSCEEAQNRMEAISVFIRVYGDASLSLRTHLIRWFLQPYKTKFHCHGPKYEKALLEFRALAFTHHLRIDECRIMFQDERCRNELWQTLSAEFKTVYQSKEGMPEILENILDRALIDSDLLVGKDV